MEEVVCFETYLKQLLLISHHLLSHLVPIAYIFEEEVFLSDNSVTDTAWGRY